MKRIILNPFQKRVVDKCLAFFALHGVEDRRTVNQRYDATSVKTTTYGDFKIVTCWEHEIRWKGKSSYYTLRDTVFIPGEGAVTYDASLSWDDCEEVLKALYQVYRDNYLYKVSLQSLWDAWDKKHAYYDDPMGCPADYE